MVIKRSNLVLCMLGASLIAPALMPAAPRSADAGIVAAPTGITVKGNVSDEAGPLIGVSVKVVGTSGRTFNRCVSEGGWNLQGSHF